MFFDMLFWIVNVKEPIKEIVMFTICVYIWKWKINCNIELLERFNED